MSIKLKENQLLAAYLLATGIKTSEILEQLKIRPETLSRWRQDSEFIKAIQSAQETILEEIIDSQKSILILSQDTLIKAFHNDKLDDFKKSMIALRYLSLLKGKDTIDDKYERKLSSISFDNKFGI